MCNWNAIVACRKKAKVVGEYDSAESDETGARFIEFCSEHRLIVHYATFKNHKRQRFTWNEPKDNDKHQRDYTMAHQRFKNKILFLTRKSISRKNYKDFPG